METIIADLVQEIAQTVNPARDLTERERERERGGRGERVRVREKGEAESEGERGVRHRERGGG